MKELKDTIENMVSDDYRKRFIAEYEQLCIRAKKLNDFIDRICYAKATGKEEPKHDCSLAMLKRQLSYMILYKNILQTRAIVEEIELPRYDDPQFNALL